MHLKIKAMIIAGASVAAIIWTICYLIMSQLMGSMYDYMPHMASEDFAGHMNGRGMGGYLFGLITWPLMAGIISGLFAYIYNRVSGDK